MSLDFEVIGPYQISEVLGLGGMGTVYKGSHAKTQDPVAIKVISAAMAQHARFRRRFDAEIQTLLRLKHPNIVALIGYGEEKGLLFYSMEYVDGENMHLMLRREKRIRWERVLDWAIEISSALKHAHDFGIVHRDLKPANLMINSSGHVKLTDFGIAKLFGSSEQTVPGSILGTADFMSPEQAEGKSVTVRSDLYALGAICYAAIAGRPPFAGSNVPEILFNVRYAKLAPLQELVADVPSEFCELIDELLRRDPTQRPPTAMVVSKRLQSLKIGLAKRDEATPSPMLDVPMLDVPKLDVPMLDVKRQSELTSLDMSDHPSIAKLSDATDPQSTRLVDRGALKNLGGEQPPSVRKSETSASISSAPSAAGPNDPTHMEPSQESSQLPDIPSGIGAARATNFTQVTDKDRIRSTLVLSDQPSHDPWQQWLSVAGIGILLVACLVAAYWFSRPPSADTLFRPIEAAMVTEDEERLEQVEESARRFLDAYPDDERAEDVKLLIENIEIRRTVRQLQRRANDTVGSNLDAVEQAFMDSARLVSSDPVLARRKLQAMATVFPDRERMTRRQQQLLKAAQKLLDRLADAPTTAPRNVALESLQEQTVWAEANLTADQRDAWLRGVIELYSDKPWASEIVEKAKRTVEAKLARPDNG